MPHLAIYMRSGLLATALLPLISHAQVLTSNVKIDWVYPSTGTIFATATKTATPAPEVTCPGNYGLGDTPTLCQFVGGGPFSIDINASSIVLSSSANFWSAGLTYNGFRFTFDAGIPSIVGASLTTNNGMASNNRVSFTPNSVAIDLRGLDLVGEPPHFYTLNIVFAGSPAAQVPTTGRFALGLLGVVLAALALSFIRRRSAP